MKGRCRKEKEKLSLFAVISFVVSNILGTGIFTTLGLQLQADHNGFSILFFWLIGGILVFCGALVYSELGASMPRSGGDYHYLSVIYHPSVGFIAGFITLIIGFSAPIALSCMALAIYTQQIFPTLNPLMVALFALTVLSLVHTFNLKTGSWFQNIILLFTLLFVFIFIIAGFLLTKRVQPLDRDFIEFTPSSLVKPSAAIGLIYITYAFSGWNASGYIAGVIQNPQKNLPKSLLISTVFVSLLYFALIFLFLYSTPKADLSGKVDVGFIVGTEIFGKPGGFAIALMIILILISTISSSIFICPRTLQAIGEDFPLFNLFSRKSKTEIPVFAIWFQFGITALLILTSSFDEIITYAGFTLNFVTLFSVAGIFIHRHKFPDAERPFKTWGYPVVPIVYLVIVCWSLIFLIYIRPIESLLGLTTIIAGFTFYMLNQWYITKRKNVANE